MDVLAREDNSRCLAAEYIVWLERCLKSIRLHVSEESWQVITDRSREALDASEDLEIFANRCSKLQGELTAAFYLTEKYPDGRLVFIKNDGRDGGDSQKICDLMIIHSEKEQRLVDVKTEPSEHDGAAERIWTSSFDALLYHLSRYLLYLSRHVVFLDKGKNLLSNLGIRQAFPLLFALDGDFRWEAFSIIHKIANQDLNNGLSNWKSDKKVEALLLSLFMKPLVIRSSRIRERCFFEEPQQIGAFLSKRRLDSVIRSGIERLQRAGEQQVREGYEVLGLHLSVELRLPRHLQKDFFGHNNWNMKVITEGVRRIFDEILNKLSFRNCDFELIMPLQIVTETQIDNVLSYQLHPLIVEQIESLGEKSLEDRLLADRWGRIWNLYEGTRLRYSWEREIPQRSSDKGEQNANRFFNELGY